MNLDHIIATTSFMSRDLDNLQATKLLFSAGGRKVMGMGNLNKSKKKNQVINTTALKLVPQRTIWTKSYLVKVPLNVNIVKQDLLQRKQFLKIL